MTEKVKVKYMSKFVTKSQEKFNGLTSPETQLIENRPNLTSTNFCFASIETKTFHDFLPLFNSKKLKFRFAYQKEANKFSSRAVGQ